MLLSFLHPWMEGDEKSRPPGPSSEEGVGAVLFPLTGAEQEVAMRSRAFPLVRGVELDAPRALPLAPVGPEEWAIW